MDDFDDIINEPEPIICPDCGGTGMHPWLNQTCRTCGGTGELDPQYYEVGGNRAAVFYSNSVCLTGASLSPTTGG